MAKFDYSKLKATAERLINRFGRSATLLKPGDPDSGQNPWDPGSPDPVASTITLVETSYSMTNRDASLVQAGDKIWIVSTDGAEPELQDKIELDSRQYELLDVQPLNPGGTKLLFTVHARS